MRGVLLIMQIRKAVMIDKEEIKDIVVQTIKAIYPRYYPKGAVEFFLTHHSEENIIRDIEANKVFVLENKGKLVGTVTIKENEICRLFILPTHQRNGFGTALLIFAEDLISKSHGKIQIDVSLPAKKLYLKQGYKEIESHTILTDNGDYLFYDVMERLAVRQYEQ